MTMDTQDASREEEEAPRMKSPDLISLDHKARLVWELVQGLDLTGLYDCIKAVEGHAGRPAIDPRILVSLWIYASDEHIARRMHGYHGYHGYQRQPRPP